MSKPLIGALSVPNYRLFSVAWLSGLASIGIATLTGIWSIYFAEDIFGEGRVWVPMVSLIGSGYPLLGWVILIGGLLGAIGLARRNRAISVLACANCILWSCWVTAFLGWAAIHGEPSLYFMQSWVPIVVYVLRLWLVVSPPAADEDRGEGW